MSIISKALEKSGGSLPGQPETESSDAKAEKDAPPQPSASNVVLGMRTSPRPVSPAPQRATPVASSVASPSAALPLAKFLLLGAMLAIVGVGVGFFMNQSPRSASSPAPSPDSTASKVSEAAPIAPVATAAPSMIEPPAGNSTQGKPADPVQTPVVVKVELSVKGEDKPRYEPREILDEPPPPRSRPKFRSVVDEEPEEPPAKPSKNLTLDEAREMYKLDGIFYSDKDPMAVINDEIMKEGQSRDEMTLIKIKTSSVTIRVGGKEYELR